MGPEVLAELRTLCYLNKPSCITVRWEIGYLIFFATFVAYFLIPYGQKFIRPSW